MRYQIIDFIRYWSDLNGTQVEVKENQCRFNFEVDKKCNMDLTQIWGV